MLSTLKKVKEEFCLKKMLGLDSGFRQINMNIKMLLTKENPVYVTQTHNRWYLNATIYLVTHEKMPLA